MLRFAIGEVAEKAAGAGILGSARRPSIEALGDALHPRRMDADRFRPRDPHLPMRPARMVAAHVLAPQQRDVIAEASGEAVNQLATVLAFLGRHAGEHSGCGWVGAAKLVSEVGVDARVLLLVADGEGEYFGLAEFVDTLHDSAASWNCSNERPVSPLGRDVKLEPARARWTGAGHPIDAVVDEAAGLAPRRRAVT